MAQAPEGVKAQVQKRLVPPSYKPPVKAAQKDTKSNADRGRARTFERTPAYRGAVRQTYNEQPTAQRSIIARHATGAPLSATAKLHMDRLGRNQELRQSQATKDTKGNQDYYRGRAADRVERSHTELVNLANEIIQAHKNTPLPGVTGDTKTGLERVAGDAYKLTPKFESDFNAAAKAGDEYRTAKAAAAEDKKYSGFGGAGLAVVGLATGSGPLYKGALSAGNALGDYIKTMPMAEALTKPGTPLGDTGVGKAAVNTVANFGKELVNLPANVVPSAYHVLEPIVAARLANPADPNGANVQSGIQESVSRLANPYKNLASPKGWENNPLTNALMLGGALKGGDRVAGRVEQGAYPHRATRTVELQAAIPGTRAKKGIEASFEKGKTKSIPISQPDIGSKSAFIKNRPKANRDATPTVEHLTQNVKPGPPGLSIQDEHVRHVDQSGKTVGFADKPMGGTKVVVKRDKNGKVLGAMQFFLEPDGKPGLTSIAVAKGHRGKGIGTELINYAQKQGFDMSAAAKHPDNAFTAAGAALTHKATVNDPLKSLKVTQYKSISGTPAVPRTKAVPAVTKEEKYWTTKPSRPYPILEEKLPGTAAANLVLPRQGAIAQRLQAHSHKNVARMSDNQVERRMDETYYTSVHQSRQEAYAAQARAKENGATDEQIQKIGEDTIAASRERWHDESVKDMALRDKAGRLKTYHFIDGKGGAAQAIEKFGLQMIDEGRQATMQTYKHNKKKDSREYTGAVGKGVQTLVPRKLQTGPNKGKWVLMPKRAADQLDQHQAYLNQTPASAILQGVSGTFRRVVLPFSPKWLANNYTEAALRGAINGVGPLSHHEATSVFKQLAPQQQAEWNQLVKSAGHGGMQRQMLQEATSWQERLNETRYQGLGEALTKYGQKPGPRTMANLHNKWTDLVFGDLNGRMENSLHTAMAGKILRRHPLMSQKLVDLSHEAMKNPEGPKTVEARNNLIALGREVDRMFGKYGKFSPGWRRSIATFTPFIPWSLNAVHFVTQHLPNDHPVVTSLIASAHQAATEWRNKHGLGYFIDGQRPPWLQGAIPGSGDSSWMIFTQGTPFSAWGDPTGTAARGFNPLGSTILSNLSGRDWKGDKLPNANPYVNLETAILSMLEATTPIGYATQKTTGGAGSTTENLKNWANPYHPVKPKQPKGKKSGDIFAPGKKSKSYDPLAGNSKSKSYDPLAP